MTTKQTVTERLRSLDSVMLADFASFADRFEYACGSDTEYLIPCSGGIDANHIAGSVESIDPRIVGLVVDYMSAYMLDESMSAPEAFKLAAKGGSRLANYDFIYDMGSDYFKRLLGEDVDSAEKVEDVLERLFAQVDRSLSRESIDAAAKLTWFDEFARGSGAKLGLKVPLDGISVDDATARNIGIMIRRACSWLGPTLDGYELDVGNDPEAEFVSSAVIDYVSRGCLWDMKCATNDPGVLARLQVLCYLIMGTHLGAFSDKPVDSIGIVNPRRDETLVLPIESVKPDELRIACEVIVGYPSDVTDALVDAIVHGESLESEYTAQDIRKKTYDAAMSRIDALREERQNA